MTTKKNSRIRVIYMGAIYSVTLRTMQKHLEHFLNDPANKDKPGYEYFACEIWEDSFRELKGMKEQTEDGPASRRGRKRPDIQLSDIDIDAARELLRQVIDQQKKT